MKRVQIWIAEITKFRQNPYKSRFRKRETREKNNKFRNKENGKKKLMFISESVLRLKTVVVLETLKASQLRAWRYVTQGFDG